MPQFHGILQAVIMTRFPFTSTRLCTTLLGATVLVAVLAVATVGSLAMGSDRPNWNAAVGFAAGVCLVSSLGGWLITRAFSAENKMAVAGAIAGVSLRIFLPLVALVWLNTGGEMLRTAGTGGLLAAFYLLLLATDIFLHIIVGKFCPALPAATASNRSHSVTTISNS